MAVIRTNPVVLNIPHARWEVPDAYFDRLIAPEWQWIYETLVLNDWFTDELFDIANVHRIIAPVSRLLVDTERLLPDEAEPMSRHGMGCLYTHGTQGQRLWPDHSKEERQELLDKYYHPHHRALADAIQQSLDADGKCLFVDCHSFPDKPFPHEDQDLARPDICLGTLPGNTPATLVDMLIKEFTDCGYEVAVDTPFSGCARPERYCGDTRVLAVMIEVNRKLYIDQPIPPYSAAVKNKANLPVRNANTARIKQQLQNAILRALRKFVKPVPPRSEGDNGPPEDQRQLSRFLHEMNSGDISPAMRQWWWDRY